jgi:hypothetical protein
VNQQQDNIDSGQWMEMYNLMRALLRRVEALEKLAGVGQQPSKACVYCAGIGGHQLWCHVPKAPGGK